LGKTFPLNFSENIAVALGVYARTPMSGATLGDHVNAAFGPLKVYTSDIVSFDRDDIDLTQDSTEVTIKISASATPATLSLTSSDSSIVSVPATVSFAKGETEKTVILTRGIPGKATVTIGEIDNVIPTNVLNVASVEPAGVKLEDNFDGTAIDSNLWTISDAGYETGYTQEDFFGVKDGKLVVENMVATQNYWGGKSLVSKKTFLGTTETSLKITVDFGDAIKTAGVSFGHGLILRNADNSHFFAIRNTRGEGGWVYNVAKGAGGTQMGVDSDAGGIMEVTYNGKTITIVWNGTQIGSVGWTCNDPMYIELGFYAREEGASGNASINSVKVENILVPPTYPSVTLNPSSTVRAVYGFNNLLAITVPEDSIENNDVTVFITSRDAAVAYPEVGSVTFKQDGETTQFINIINAGNGYGETTLDLTTDLEGLLAPSVGVKAYMMEAVLFEDDFNSGKIDSDKWFILNLTGNDGVAKEATYTVNDGVVNGYIKTGTGNYPIDSLVINEEFFPTTEEPVMIEFEQGPFSGLGNLITTMATVINADTSARMGFGRARGDVTGWNLFSNYAGLGEQGHTPAALQTKELLDNTVNHKVRIIQTAGACYFFVDDIYGGSISLALDAVTFALGGTAYTENNNIAFSYDNVKVYGTPVISMDTTEIDVSEGSGVVSIVVPTAILNAGTELTLTIDNPDVAAFDTGATKTISLNSGSDRYQSIPLTKVGTGETFVTLANSGNYKMTADTVNVHSANTGSVLFEDDFTAAEISTADWYLDTKGFEFTQYPDADGDYWDMTAYAGYGIYMDFTATGQYWGGRAYFTTKGFKASKADPLTYEVSRESFNYNEGATGARSAIIISNGDFSKWIHIDQCVDSGNDYGWGWNKLTGASDDKSNGVPNTMVTPDHGQAIIQLVIDGENVQVFVNGTRYAILDFPVDEDIHFGFGVYARAIGDSVNSVFNSVKVIGSDDPAPNAPSIISQPNNTTVAAGQPASFTVIASGKDLVYTWFKDGTPIEYISDPTYTIPAASTADEGEYTVEVANAGGSVMSTPATLTILQDKIFSDDFVGPELSDAWMIDTKPFETGDGELSYKVDNGLFLEFTLTANYWGGRTFYLKDSYSASKDAPVTFEATRTAYGHNEGCTGVRSSIIISNADGSKWINFNQNMDEGVYRGWGWNKLTGAADDKASGTNNTVEAFAPMNDAGEHVLSITVDGETAILSVDGVAGVTLDFPVSEGIRFGVGVFTRMVPDYGWTSFSNVTVWGNAPEPTYSTANVNYNGSAKGSVEENPVGTFTVKGCGADVWGTDDQFFYVYEQIDTDFDVSVKIDSFTANSNAWAKAGLTVREANEDGTIPGNGRHVSTQIQALNQVGGSSNDYWTSWRNAVGANVGDGETVHNGSPIVNPSWLRITKEGGVLTTYFSKDGNEWTQQATVDTTAWADGAIGASMPLYVGLWVTSHNADSNDATAVFSDWIINTPEPPVSDLVLDYSIEGDELVLRWDAATGASLEVAPTADSASWTIMEAELVGGAWQCRVPMSEAAAFYRLTK
ncbi:MAG: immunoglobulin domain-containing protein, partial [Verrucomicrobia bacterium]|nr:immunoglobulin domain-containing protein [Verrucomicrobiota bacterium]